MTIVFAVVLALVLVELSSRSGVIWRLVTFTYQANLLAAVYYAWTLVSPRADARTGLRGAVVLYVVVAGVIWNLFLTGRSMGYTSANVLVARRRAAAGGLRLAAGRQGQAGPVVAAVRLARVPGGLRRPGARWCSTARAGVRRTTSSTPAASESPRWQPTSACSQSVSWARLPVVGLGARALG